MLQHQDITALRIYLTLIFVPIILLYYFLFDDLHFDHKNLLERSSDLPNQIRINLNITMSSPTKTRSFNCTDRELKTEFVLQGKFWILYDFIPADLKFRCDQSVTYAAPGDFNFLDNVVPLVNRWNGPVSISLYAPGTDFSLTMLRVRYLRDCASPLVKKYVTFHIFFDSDHFPDNVTQPDLTIPMACNLANPLKSVESTYRKRNGLDYPLGFARNVAMDRSQTYYFLNSDIEQYPSPGFIKNFLALVKTESLNSTVRKVYVLPHFEVSERVTTEVLPKNKAELKVLLRKNLAISFHDKICYYCHRSPFLTEWMNAKVEPGLKVFNVGKREYTFGSWEPFFVGTSEEPRFDDRFTWEGNKDKRVQGYIMCLLNYEYHILDNAFLIHRPGIKAAQNKAAQPIQSQRNQLELYVKPQLNKLYGNRSACKV